MKRGVLVLLLVLVVGLHLVSAAVNDTEQTKVSKAYSCLKNKTSGNCALLSIQEKTFSVLATGQCRTELTAASDSGNCWPSGNCKVKDTAQAALALKSNPPLDWLSTKNQTPSELTWYLEIEATAAATCTIEYGSSSYSISIDEDKKIDSDAGSCLLLDSDGYWLRISNSCHNTPFTVSCNENFLTTTLFRKQDSGTVHISSEASSAAASGSTTEEVSSYCFADSGACNYEGTLWAALALDAAGRNVAPYLPYLITFASDNGRYVPNSFLYHLTANEDYRLSLLSQQKSNQYWMEAGDEYYDSALALYSLKQDTSQEKEKAKTWLLNTQDNNGCWENNLRNTAFILASVWPGSSGSGGGGGGTLPSCESQGNYCSSSADCTSSGGTLLDSYSCSGVGQRCCSLEPEVKTCSELGGDICSSNQRCVGGTEPGAADTDSGEICCASGGYCSVVDGGDGSECEINDGVCRSGGCDVDEEEGSFSCESLSQNCCVKEDSDDDVGPGPDSDGPSSMWIWILLILIVLVVLGILLRNKIRMFWFRISHSGSGGSPPPRPTFPGFIQRPIQRIERRIMVPHHASAQTQRPVMSRMKSGAQKELDDVLTKLKEMGR